VDPTVLEASIAAAFAGLLAALTGLGGGVVMVPVLTILIGMDITRAIGLSLAAIAVNASISGSRYLDRGLVDVDRAAIYASLAVPAAYIGGSIAWRVDSGVLTLLFALFLVYVSYSMAMNSGRVTESADATLKGGGSHEAKPLVLAVLAGLLSGLLGIGGGTVIMPLLTVVEGVEPRIAVATSTVVVAITASAGFAAHITEINAVYAGFMSIAAACGSYAGSKVMIRMESRRLRLLISATLAVVALRMMVDVILGGG